VVDTRVAKVRHTYTTKTTTTTWTTRIRYGRCSVGARVSREYTKKHHSFRDTTENSPNQCTPCVRLIRKITIGQLLGIPLVRSVSRVVKAPFRQQRFSRVVADRSSLSAVSGYPIAGKEGDDPSNLTLHNIILVGAGAPFELIF